MRPAAIRSLLPVLTLGAAGVALLPALQRASAQGSGSLPVIRARVEKESPDTLELWGSGCSLYCAVGPSVRASSSLKDKGKAYPATQAHDFDLGTAWAEGKPGPGTGEYLEYTYDLSKGPVSKGLAVTTVTFFNGYRKSDHLWKANGRVKRFRLLVDGRPRAYIDLADTPKMQTAELKPISLPKGKKVALRFEIAAVYPGSQYQDTVVTDISFDGTGHH